ncbi:MAG: DUF6174 domain-containing protein [Acidimicrobiales bacterium]
MDNTGPAPWTTFAVSEWFTIDVGTEIALWSPGFEGQPGEEWLVSSSRYGVGNLSSGDVYWCESELFAKAAHDRWAKELGAPVTAGAATAERPAGPQARGVLAASEARWRDNKPSSYTYTVRVSTNFGRWHDRQTCATQQHRVVVKNDTVIQAKGIGALCDLTLEDVPTIEDLFELAKRAGGAVQSPVDYDADFGFVRDVYAEDRSIQIYAGVVDFSVGAFPLSGDPLAELDDQRALWERQGPRSYTWELQMRCFCSPGLLKMTVIDRQPDPNHPLGIRTVEELFDFIGQNANADIMQIAYHPDFGYPIEVRADRYFNGSDDEITYIVSDLTALDG